MAEQKFGTCVYCGSEGPITDDHVFPRVIFYEADEAMLTVPACDSCNQAKSHGDRDLRNFILMDVGGSLHEHAEAMTEKMLRPENDRLRAWVAQQLEMMEEVELVTEDGTVVGTVLSNDFNMERILAAQEMTVRALFYHEKQQIMPAECPIFVQHVPWYAAPDLIKKMTSAAPTLFKTKGKQVASWGFHSIEGGDEHDTSWLVFYNNWVLFWIVTGKVAITAQAGRKAFLQDTEVDQPSRVSRERRRIVVPLDPEGNPLIPPQ